MHSRTHTLACGVGLLVALTACGDAASRAAGPVADPSFAKGGNLDLDSRAILVWDDDVAIDDVPVPAGITGDGRNRLGQVAGTLNEYEGDVCGVHAKIFNTSSRSGSGDLVFDPDFDYSTPACPVKRLLRFHLVFPDRAGTPGVEAEIGTFTNVRGIWAVAETDTIQQAMRFNYVGLTGCATIAFDSAYAVDEVRVIGLASGTDGEGRTIRRWRVESTGAHMAMCTVVQKNRAVPSERVFLPFAFEVTEVRNPAATGS